MFKIEREINDYITKQLNKEMEIDLCDEREKERQYLISNLHETYGYNREQLKTYSLGLLQDLAIDEEGQERGWYDEQ